MPDYSTICGPPSSDMAQLEPKTFVLQDLPVGDVPAMLLEDLGSREGGDERVRAHGVTVALGTRPLAYNVRDFFDLAGVEANELKLYRLFDVWLIVHHVGIGADLRSRPVRAIRYEADFGAQPVCTLGLAPDLEFFESQLGSLTFSATLEANGSLRGGAPEPAPTSILQLGGGLRLALGSKLNLQGELALGRRKVALVHAVGLGSGHCEWHFRAGDDPLIGSQTMAQLFLFPTPTERLQFKIRAEVVLGSSLPGFVSTRSTSWVDVEASKVTDLEIG